MYYVIGTCILIALVAYYIVYLLGKKSGRQEWIIEQNKMKNYYVKQDRKRFNDTPVYDLCTTMPYNLTYTNKQLTCLQSCLPDEKILYLWHIHDSWDNKCI
jgi:hypothetical protein